MTIVGWNIFYLKKEKIKIKLKSVCVIDFLKI